MNDAGLLTCRFAQLWHGRTIFQGGLLRLLLFADKMSVSSCSALISCFSCAAVLFLFSAFLFFPPPLLLALAFGPAAAAAAAAATGVLTLEAVDLAGDLRRFGVALLAFGCSCGCCVYAA